MVSKAESFERDFRQFNAPRDKIEVISEVVLDDKILFAKLN